MNEISPQQLLSQIRAVQSELHGPQATQPAAGNGFGDLLKSAISEVNDVQKSAAGTGQSRRGNDRLTESGPFLPRNDRSTQQARQCVSGNHEHARLRT